MTEKEKDRIQVVIGEARDLLRPDRIEAGVCPLLLLQSGASSVEVKPREAKYEGSSVVLNYKWRGRLEAAADSKLQYSIFDGDTSGRLIAKGFLKYKKLHRGEVSSDWRTLEPVGRLHVEITPAFGKIDKPQSSRHADGLFGAIAQINPFVKAKKEDPTRPRPTALREFKASQIQRTLPHLASGASGVVYKGYVKDLEAVIAIKDMPVNKMSVFSEWKREVEFMALNPHPYIVQVHGYAATNEALTIVMEFCAGGTLYSALHENNEPLPLGQRMKMARQACSAITHLHEHNIMHRDIKSLNFLLTKELVLKLADFGTAKNTLADTHHTLRAGTPLWMAPEVKSGTHYTLSADIYSLGVVLYELFQRALPDYDDDTERVCIDEDASFVGRELVLACIDEASARPSANSISVVIAQWLYFTLTGSYADSTQESALDSTPLPTDLIVQQRAKEGLATLVERDSSSPLAYSGSVPLSRNSSSSAQTSAESLMPPRPAPIQRSRSSKSEEGPKPLPPLPERPLPSLSASPSSGSSRSNIPGSAVSSSLFSSDAPPVNPSPVSSRSPPPGLPRQVNHPIDLSPPPPLPPRVLTPTPLPPAQASEASYLGRTVSSPAFAPQATDSYYLSRAASTPAAPSNAQVYPQQLPAYLPQASHPAHSSSAPVLHSPLPIHQYQFYLTQQVQVPQTTQHPTIHSSPVPQLPQPPQFTAPVERYVRLQYSFQPINPGELDVKGGDVLRVLQEQGVWLQGRSVDGRVGWVPRNYTTPL